MGDLFSQCRGEPPVVENADPTVTLHIYDVAKSKQIVRANRVFRMLGTGAFHGAVEIYGPEWSYTGCDGEGTGVFSCAPKVNSAHTYRESIPMGQTKMTQEQVRDL